MPSIQTLNVSHHLTDETVQEYSAGALSLPMETLVACHLTVCEHCRTRTERADQIGGFMVSASESVQVSTSAADLLQRSRTENAAQDKTVARRAAIAGVPRPLGRLLGKPIEQLEWKRIAPGIKQFNLDVDTNRKGAFKLLHLTPGASLSDHSHEDRELTYVVRGSYHDEIGQFKTGDIADLDGHHSHKPVIDSAEPCIALIATHSPVRYSGLFSRLMQPFVGI
jgi:putative transcriptional regulator